MALLTIIPNENTSVLSSNSMPIKISGLMYPCMRLVVSNSIHTQLKGFLLTSVPQ